MNKYSLLIFITALMLLLGVLSPALGLTVNGIELVTDAPNFVEYSLAVLQTYWFIMTFQIDGLPALFGLVFWLLTFSFGFVIVSLIRGVS